MKTDTCPLCGGVRHIGIFSAVCGSCDVPQLTPEAERLKTARAELCDAVVRQFRWKPFYERFPNWRKMIRD